MPAASESWTVGGAFLLGLMGGAGHCSAMCGGFAIAFRRARRDQAAASSLDTMMFHAGRIFTYALLAGLLMLPAALPVGLDAPWRALVRLLLAMALLWFALELARPGFGPPLKPARWIAQRIQRAFRRFWQGGLLAVFVSGAAWGFIPCMFSWSAITAAVAVGPPTGLWMLAAFGLGTVVPLLVVSRLDWLLPDRHRPLARMVTAAVVAVYGVVLFVSSLTRLL